MKQIKINKTVVGSGISYVGWSGRGWPDGGPEGAGPLNQKAPSWEECGEEIGVNMVRMGITIKHFLKESLQSHLTSKDVKKGLENKEVSWAKSEQTPYSHTLQRCKEQGWKVLVCLNPSYQTPFKPSVISPSSQFLKLWRDFCFHLGKTIQERWPGTTEHFEIANEPDIGYFDGESFLPNYEGAFGGITPLQYCLLLEKASEGIREAVPGAKILGPGLASWNKKWIDEVLSRSGALLDGISYHNVRGNLKDNKVLKKARKMWSQHNFQSSPLLFNSEWAWWPDHDIREHETAFRAARILYNHIQGGAQGSFYLGPAQPKGFNKGLGVIQFDPQTPDSVEKTRTFYAFRIMARGIKGGEILEVKKSPKKPQTLALLKPGNRLVITLLNPSKKKKKNLSISLDKSLLPQKENSLTVHKFDANHSDDAQKADFSILERFDMEPQSITQFVV